MSTLTTPTMTAAPLVTMEQPKIIQAPAPKPMQTTTKLPTTAPFSALRSITDVARSAVSQASTLAGVKPPPLNDIKTSNAFSPLTPPPVSPTTQGILSATTNATAPTPPKTEPLAPIAPLGGESPKPKEVKISTADPNFEDTAGAILIQRQKERAITNQLFQNQAARSQFMQQLQDNGQRGGTLATLAMLKDRELNSALNTVEWNFTEKYLDYLQETTTTAEAESKARFMAEYNTALNAGDIDAANALMAAMAEQYPGDTFIQTAATPEYQQAVIGGATNPQAQKRMQEGFANTAAWLGTKGNVFDPTVLKTNVAEILSNLRASVSTDQLKIMSASMTDNKVKDYLKEYYPEYANLSPAEVPDSIREEAALMDQFQGQVGLLKNTQAAAIATQKVMNIKGLNATTQSQLQSVLPMLIAGEGDIQMPGINIPADYFTDISSGASSIFTSDWDGDVDFANRIPEANALDGLWVRAVKEMGGDFTLGEANPDDLRQTFAEAAFSAAAELGFGNGDDFAKMSASQMDLVMREMKKNIQPAYTGAGSYPMVAQAFRSGNIDAIEGQLQTMDYANPRHAATIEKVIDALGQENGGALPTFKPPRADSEWITSPGSHWMTMPNGYGGQALILVEVGEPTYVKGTKSWNIPITVTDPTGKADGGLIATPNQDIQLTAEEAKKRGLSANSPSKGLLQTMTDPYTLGGDAIEDVRNLDVRGLGYGAFNNLRAPSRSIRNTGSKIIRSIL